MDAGRQWVLENLGTYGPTIREAVAAAVREEHAASLDAQEASGHRSQGVYGEFWRGVLERLEPLGELPGVTLVRPGAAPYRVPVANRFAIFPWRFARSRRTSLHETVFATSPTRSSLLELPAPRHQQGILELNVPDAGLTDEDREVLKHLGTVTTGPSPAATRLLLVAISSSSSGLFSAEWGEVRPSGDACLAWDDRGFHENLLTLPSRPTSTSQTKSFVSGPMPTRRLGAREARSES